MTDRQILERYIPLIDIDIERAGTDGTGRTVVAYAASFDHPHYVFDPHDGHIEEVIDRAAFNRTIGNGTAPQVLFNHGRDLFGNSSDRFAMPLGTPVEVRAETRGLLTRTRYANTDLADEVLELIRAGAIRGQSFRGAVYRSSVEGETGDGRPIIRRLELGLKEYGPSPFPLDDGAQMLALRSAALIAEPDTDSPSDPPPDPAADSGTPEEHSDDPDTDDPQPDPDDGSLADDDQVSLLAFEQAQRRRRHHTPLTA